LLSLVALVAFYLLYFIVFLFICRFVGSQFNDLLAFLAILK